MRRDREGRRTVVQFLSGLAVGTVATLVLAPLASGTLRYELVTGALVWRPPYAMSWRCGPVDDPAGAVTEASLTAGRCLSGSRRRGALPRAQSGPQKKAALRDLC